MDYSYFLLVVLFILSILYLLLNYNFISKQVTFVFLRFVCTLSVLKLLVRLSRADSSYLLLIMPANKSSCFKCIGDCFIDFFRQLCSICACFFVIKITKKYLHIHLFYNPLRLKMGMGNAQDHGFPTTIQEFGYDFNEGMICVIKS